MPGETVSEPKGALGSGLSDIESRIAALESSNQWWPGMLAWTAGDVAPPGFLVADGSAFDVDRYAALSAALGGASTLPNLVDRMVVGAGNLYALASTGGSSSVTLTGAQSGMPAHTTGAGSAHTHGASTGGGSAHTHGPGAGTFIVNTGAGAVALTLAAGAQNFPTSTAVGFESGHTHSVTVNNESAHTHSVSAVSASSAVSLLNPYYAALPLIHV